MPPVKMSEENRFFNGLKRLFQKLIEDVKNGGNIQNKVRDFLESDEMDSFLRRIVGRMVKSSRAVSARSWREAATKGGNGPLIYNLIKNEMDGPVGQMVWELIADNVAFIKTVPQEWAKYITQYAAREALKGARPEEVEAKLRKIMPEHMTKNLKCIARTECAKANAAIVQARAEMCGINAYFWRCVKDNRSRDSHILMDRVLVFYNDPPSPEELAGEKYTYGRYHAGNIFNCRCYQEPVVDPKFLPDIFKVYSDGQIRTMTRGAFLKQYDVRR